MPFLNSPPVAMGEQVYFNDQIFVFEDTDKADLAARELAQCNESGSLWALVDLTARFKATEAGDTPRYLC